MLAFNSVSKSFIMSDMTMGQRIRQARESAHISQDALAKLCISNKKPGGINRAAVSSWESDKTCPEVDNLRVIAKETKHSLDWIILGPEATSPDFIGVRETSVVYANKSLPPKGYIRFEVLDVQAACGDGHHPPEFPEAVQSIDVLETWAKERFNGGSMARIQVITARGTSMQGTIENGDILFVDVTVRHYESEAIYAIAIDNEVRVKRLQKMTDGRLAILSDNPLNEPEYIDQIDMHRIHICGLVLASWTLKRFW